MQEFTPGKSARAAHQAILASIRTMDNAKQHAVLWYADIQRRRLYRELGYPSMNMYATTALGFSSSRASEFTRLADKLDQLPQLRAALEDGEIGYTKASQVARVSNKQNEGQWLNAARTNSRRELEKKIKRAKGKAAAAQKGQPELLIPDQPQRQPAAVVPVRLTIEFTPEQFARYEALLERIRKISGSGHPLPADRAEAWIELLAAYAGTLQSERAESEANQSKANRSKANRSEANQSEANRSEANQSKANQSKAILPEKTTHTNKTETSTNSRRRESPPFQVHLHRCPDCERTTIQTGRGELPVNNATTQRALCDSQVAQPGKRNTRTIPPRTRREVLSRDRHRCRRPGCTNTRFLEVHHLTPRARGGGNEPGNLITLCAACHQLAHEKKWSPAELVREIPPAYGRAGHHRASRPTP